MRFHCWVESSYGHGLVLYNPIWLPEDETPDKTGCWYRVPQLDFNQTRHYYVSYRDGKKVIALHDYPVSGENK